MFDGKNRSSGVSGLVSGMRRRRLLAASWRFGVIGRNSGTECRSFGMEQQRFGKPRRKSGILRRRLVAAAPRFGCVWGKEFLALFARLHCAVASSSDV